MSGKPRSILIIGAGELGMAVLHGLVYHRLSGDVPISVMIRPSSLTNPSPSKKADMDRLRALGIRPIPGDIEGSSQDELTSIFAPFDTVIGCSGMAGAPGIQTKLAKAAIAAKVKRYIPWQYGVDYDIIGRGSAQHLFDEQLEVRAILRGQNVIQWLIVSVGVFMSFVFAPAFGVVDREKGIVRALGDWKNQLTTTTVHDIGRVVAETVFDGGDVWSGDSKVVKDGVTFMAGETLDFEQLASSVSKVLGKEVKRELVTLDDLKERLDKDPDDGMAMYGAVWAEGKGVAWDKATTINEQYGMSMTGVDDWAAVNLK